MKITQQKDWKKFFLAECTKLQKKCFWSSRIISTLKKSSEKACIPFQNEILSLNFIYSSEYDDSFHNFAQNFKEKLLIPKLRTSKKENMKISDDSEYLDSEIYSRAKSKYEPYSFLPSKQSINEPTSSYQNNTIIENNKNCANTNLNFQQYEETLILKKKGLSHYKLVTDAIEDHLDKKGHPLREIKERFIHEFVNFFEEKSPNLIFINQEEKYRAMVTNLIEFIRIFEHVICIFYGLGSMKMYLKSMTYFTQENLLQFITSLFINNDNIYELLFKTCEDFNLEIEEKIQNNYRTFTTFQPQNFGVSKEFCLNRKTIQFFKGEEETINTFKVKDLSEPHFDHIIERKITWDINNDFLDEHEHDSCSIKSPLSMRENYMGCQKQSYLGFQKSDLAEEKNKILQIEKNPDFCKNFKKSLVDKTLLLTENKKNYDSIKFASKTIEKPMNSELEDASSKFDCPYEAAIANLKQISKLRSPIHKLKNILKTAVLIIESIKKFYEKYQRKFNDEINSDEIMSILIYICCKAEVKSLYSQCVLVEGFLTNQLSSSVAGYYLITLKASLEYIGSEEMLKEKRK